MKNKIPVAIRINRFGFINILRNDRLSKIPAAKNPSLVLFLPVSTPFINLVYMDSGKVYSVLDQIFNVQMDIHGNQFCN